MDRGALLVLFSAVSRTPGTGPWVCNKYAVVQSVFMDYLNVSAHCVATGVPGVICILTNILITIF